MKIICNNKTFEIKNKTIVYVLYRLSGKDYTNADSETLLKAMKKYKLLDEVTLDSMIKYD